jgi:hypothetical protein
MGSAGTGPLPFYRVDALEMAAGWVPGPGEPPVLSDVEVPPHPVQALEKVLLPALQQRPCVVAFSGGRDSSAVLAVAVALARREGLPLPVAVTNVYPELAETDESEWQELVIRHLGVEEWVRQEFTDETDLLAPRSLESLRRHGPLWPGTMHNREPWIAVARGGCWIDGNAGDEVLGEMRATPLVRIAERELPLGKQAIKQLVKALGPRWLRERVARRPLTRNDILRPWLRPEAAEWFVSTVARDTTQRPLSYGRAVLEVITRRGVQACFGNLDLIGESLGVRYLHPLLDPTFAISLGRFGPRFGYAGRTATMRAVFGELLPDAILTRRSKVFFNNAYAHRYTREFVARWDGTGLDPELIDLEALKRTWQQPLFHGGSFQLVHLAWLATEGASADQGVN